jgi:glycosyltransferase involved in cell wall biosynthesis
MTKFYNEQEQLPLLIENIAQQTMKPKVFVFVDDGSTDNSHDVAAEAARKHGFRYKIVQMKKKQKGNLDTLGRAWTKAQPLIKKLSMQVSYVATTDVDTRFPKFYFRRMIEYLENNPLVGVVAGQIAGTRKRTFPMFTGKIVRTEVIQVIDRYWDISIDSFLNVKALKLGYTLKVLNEMKVESPPSHLRSKRGRYRAGRLAYYAGIALSYVILKGILQFDAQYLRGYWSEWTRGAWQSKDNDIRDYYGNLLRNRLLALVKQLIRMQE